MSARQRMYQAAFLYHLWGDRAEGSIEDGTGIIRFTETWYAEVEAWMDGVQEEVAHLATV